MRYFLLTSCLAFLPLSAHANYSRLADYGNMPGVGGSVAPTQGENKAINLVRELVVLTAGDKDYSAHAEFVLSNTTDQSQSVAVTFPEGNYGNWDSYVPPPRTGFLRFKTFVDGQAVTAKRVLRKEPDESGFNAHWETTLAFAPHQKLSMSVEYAAPYGESVHWGMSRILSYWFMGKNWKGPVDESTLEVRVTQPGLWRVVANDDTHNALVFQVRRSLRGTRFHRTWRNWEAQNGVRIGLERVVPLWREDTTGDNVGTDNTRVSRVAAALAAQVVRVGSASLGLKDAPTNPYSTAAFTLNGVFYVSGHHLSSLLSEWEAEQKPRIGSEIRFSALNGFDWRVGKTRIQGQKGANTVTVNGKTVSLGAPIIGSWYSLYLPINQLARTLGWKVTMQGERLFTLKRGKWKA